METIITISLWVLAATVYLNIGWVFSKGMNGDVMAPEWWETFLDGPKAWEKHAPFTKSMVIPPPKILMILVGVIALLVSIAIMLIFWACYFTFGGGIARYFLKNIIIRKPSVGSF